MSKAKLDFTFSLRISILGKREGSLFYLGLWCYEDLDNYFILNILEMNLGISILLG